MKAFEKLQVSIDFSIKLSINSLAPGRRPRRLTPTNSYFLLFCPHFREKFDNFESFFEN